MIVALLVFWLAPMLPEEIKPPPTFHYFTIEDGLSQNAILSMHQDRDGFIWLGTQDGLNRFDGYHFRVYRHQPDDPKSLLNSYIMSMFRDHDDSIWVGTMEGLSHYLPDKDYFVNYPADAKSHIPGEIHAVLRDKRGRLWLGTLSDGIAYMDTHGQFHRLAYEGWSKNQPTPRIITMEEDFDGTLWMGTEGQGIIHYNPETGSVQHIQGGERGLRDEDVFDITLDSQNRLWIGTYGAGLQQWDRDTQEFIHHGTDPEVSGLAISYTWEVTEDRDGFLWIGTTGGLSRFDPASDQFVTLSTEKRPGGLTQSDIVSVMRDRHGALWLGTNGGGVAYHDPDASPFRGITARPSDPKTLGLANIWTIYRGKTDESLWLGGSEGLYQLDHRGKILRRFVHDPQDPQSLTHSFVCYIYEDQPGYIWIGTWGGGLNLLDTRTGKVFQSYQNEPGNEKSIPNEFISVMVKGTGNDLWITSFKGVLARLDTATGEVQRYSNEAMGVLYDIIADPRGYEHDWWLSTELWGLVNFNEQTGTFRRIKASEGPPLPHTVMDVHPDRYNPKVFWMGSFNGLFRFDVETGHSAQWRTIDGLPNDNIYGVLQDDNGNIWYSSNRGIGQLNPKTGQIINYEKRDGLMCNEHNSKAFYQDHHGNLYFGGIGGVTWFHPRDINADHQRAPLRFTDFMLANQPVPIREILKTSPLEKPIHRIDQLTLTHSQRMFSFEFAALEYGAPWRISYAYLMDGFDKQWIYTTAEIRRATYTNLPPGRYNFRVKASDRHGNWGKEELTLPIRVEAMPWWSWWAKTLYILIVLALVTLFVAQEREKTARQRKLVEQERTTAQRLRELVMRDKMTALGTLTSGVAHELNNPNNFITGASQVMHTEVEALKEWIDKMTTHCTSEEREELEECLQVLADQARLVGKNASRIAQIVKDLQQLGQSGQKSVKRGDLRAGLNAMIELLAAQHPTIVFEARLTQPLEGFWNSSILNQICSNILQNACQAVSEKQSGERRVSVEAELIEGNLTLHFQDSGTGIEPAHLDRIFDAFYTTRQQGKGMGLGLYMAYSTATELGGYIEVASKPGEGSRFSVHLPNGH